MNEAVTKRFLLYFRLMLLVWILIANAFFHAIEFEYIPLAVVLFVLIILHPYAPKVLNNVGFAYLTVACIDTTALATHLPQFFITFIVGSVLFNGVCVLLMKPAKALAVKSVQKENV